MCRSNIFFGRLVFAVACCGLSFGCSGPAAKLNVNLEGEVVDVFGLPISGATVTVTSSLLKAEDATKTTGEDGRYQIRFKGFGAFVVVVKAEGYANATTSVTVADIPDVKGSFDAGAVRNVTLYQKTGTLRGRLTRSRGEGAPVANVPLRLALLDSTIRDTSLTLTATTGADGRYEFTGLPSGLNGRLFIPAHDIDGDSTPDTAAESPTVFIDHNSVTSYNETLGDFEGPRAVWSNVNNSLVGADSKIEIFFSVPMETALNRRVVRLRQFSPDNFEVFETSNFSEDATTLTITPAQPLTTGGEYALSTTTYSAASLQEVDSSYNFTVRSDAVGPAVPTNLRRDDGGAQIDHDQTSFRIAWTQASGAQIYRVYMRRDGARISDWVLAEAVYASGVSDIHETISAPRAIRDGGSGRVFDNGSTLHIAVSALIDGLESGLSDPLMLKDEECPEITVAAQTGAGSWNNLAGTEALSVALDVRFSEPIDRTAPPTLDIAAAGVDEASFSIDWQSETRAIYRGTVPAGVDGRGMITLNAATLKDPTGNAVCVGSESFVTTSI